MTLDTFRLRIGAGRSDRKRDSQIPLPEGITQCRDIPYGRYGKWNLLDVYYPATADGKLPTIVSIHGGGYVYGSKEIYRRYCMDLARRGFAVVNFNYRLAPRWKFPAPLEDTDAVLHWIGHEGEAYHLDASRIFLVGDSAGAQLASQYAAIATVPDYAALFFPQSTPVRILGLGLNCGMYDTAAMATGKQIGIQKDYLGTKLSATDPRLSVLPHITNRFPPAHITTAYHDFLRECAKPMYNLLTARGVRAELRCYGSEERGSVGHVFHVDLRLPEATECNDDQCAFFRSCL